MLKKTIEFLTLLDANNDREWFASHKAMYTAAKAEFEAFVEKLIPLTQEIDPQIGQLNVSDCTYRIYKDIRFSKDKTPYKNHMGAYITRKGKKSPYAGYYVHIQPSGLSLWGGGLYCPDRELLLAVRKDIFENVEEFKSILSSGGFEGGFILDTSDMLKKAPTGYPSDFADIDLLKYKNYSALKPMSQEILHSDKILEYTIEAFKALVSFNRFFNFTIDESMPKDKTFAHSITHHP